MILFSNMLRAITYMNPIYFEEETDISVSLKTIILGAVCILRTNILFVANLHMNFDVITRALKKLYGNNSYSSV